MNFVRKINSPGVREKGQQSQIWQFFSFFLFARKNESIFGAASARSSRAQRALRNLPSSAKSPLFRRFTPAQVRVADESHVMRATAVISSDIQRLQEKRKKKMGAPIHEEPFTNKFTKKKVTRFSNFSINFELRKKILA